MKSEEKQPTIVGDEGNSEHTSRNRRTILELLTCLCLIVAPLLYAIDIISGGSNNPETTKERDRMYLSKAESQTNRAIPPVEANVPARIETATFALG